MDYHLKYLKYKNKYINLKNMIGNGNESKSKAQKKMDDELDSYLKKQNIIDSIRHIIIANNEKNKINKTRAESLMEVLKDIKNKMLLSNLICNIFYYNITDKEIKTIITNLFTQGNDFGIKDIQERYKLLNFFIFDFINNTGKVTQLKNLSNFTNDQFYILKKIIDNAIYRDNLIIYSVIDYIGNLTQLYIDKQTRNTIVEKLTRRVESHRINLINQQNEIDLENKAKAAVNKPVLNIENKEENNFDFV